MAYSLKVLLLFVAALFPAFGGVISYTDRSSWLLSSSALTTIDFQAQSSSGTATDYSTASGLTVAGVNFVGVTPGGYGLAVTESEGSFFWPGGFAFLMGPASVAGGPANRISATLPANITSVGLDLMSIYPGTITVILSSGYQFSLPLNGFGQPGFVGFTDTAPITGLDVYYSGALASKLAV